MNGDGDAPHLISETQRLAAQLFSGANAFAVAPVIAAALSAAQAAQAAAAAPPKHTSTQAAGETVQQLRQQGQELLVSVHGDLVCCLFFFTHLDRWIQV